MKHAPTSWPTFAAPLPINVISDLLGVPEQRWGWVAQTSLFIRDVLDPLATADPATVDATFDEITAYYSELADQRLAEPENDLMTGLVQAEEQGDRLSRDELVSFVTLLMFAGHETTTGAIANSIVALANHPNQRALVRANPDLWPNAVEELLRFDTALHTDPRTALDDIEIGGETIKKGQNLTIMLGAVNRAFVESFGDYTIDPDQIEWKQSIALRGPSRLPVSRPTARR